MSDPSNLSDHDRQRVSDAVATAERETAGEIVTILADRSDGYTDVALVWAAFFALLELLALAIWPDTHLHIYDPLGGGWVQEWTPRAIFALAASLASAVFLIVLALQLIPAVKFTLIPGPVRTARVHDAAVRAFRIGAERRTHGRTGILIYLSMREHRAEILADEAIASKVDPDVWGDALAAMLAELKQGRIADGMIAAVEHVGAVLAEHFPIEDGDTNELPDRLIEV